MKETVVLLFSGGLDSTYTMYHYLTQTELNVHAHHISLRYAIEPRWEQEDAACVSIIEWLRKNVGPVEYSTSRFDWFDPLLPRPGWDGDLCSLIGWNVALNIPGFKYLCLGAIPEDFEFDRTSDRCNEENRHNVWRAMRKGGTQEERDLTHPDKQFPLVSLNFTKQMIVQMIPRELAKLTWSCRTPNLSHDGKSHCGICKGCKALKDIGYPNI